MKTFKELFKVEGKLVLRCPDSIFFGVIMPIGIYLLISLIAGNKTYGGSTLMESSYAALITVGICATAFMGIPLTIANYRDKKILKHFFVTPVSPMMLLCVNVVLNMILSLISSAAITVLAVFAFGYELKGSVIGFLGSYFLVMLSMYSIGVLIASVSPNIRVTNVLCTVVYFPMLFLSGATIPFEIMPNILQKVSSVLPLTQGIKLLKGYSSGANVSGLLFPIILMVLVAVICQALSYKTFRWE